ncbi:uncharacterized protein LOC108111986 [Drosophila eugracilis]|uniref:uncharacterized protein LOC108111986 n=1 Tax=Drosophila eugracilis TaxID=29029 RepID=UPI001BD9B526|nr:uncharacterized protein LOC108111986 [Drosophila eugracilis]
MAYFLGEPMTANYYLKDSIAYTEDNVPVRKLCWCDAPSQLQEVELGFYFGCFGQILEIHVFEPRSESIRFHSGFVIFANATDAAKALLASDDKVFLVQASDSWEQPDAYGSHQELELDQEPSPILGLNNDCLEHIILQLQLKDQLRFGRTCQRFRTVLLTATERFYTSVDFARFKDMTLWDLRDFFQLYGARIEVLHGQLETDHAERMAKFISDHCSNLKTIHVMCSPEISLHLHVILAKAYQLEELQLQNSEIADEPLLELQNLVNLKKLNLSQNILRGRVLVKLPISIEVLDLNGCQALNVEYLPEICNRLPNLRELHINNIDTLLFPIFNEMLLDYSYPSLEVLSVTANHCSTYKFIPQLPNLRHLIIFNDLKNNRSVTNKICENLINQLVEYKSDQLEQLEMFGFEFIPREQLIQITTLIGLRVLILPDTDLPNDLLREFSRLTKLQKISLRNSNATDPCSLRRLT